MTSNPLMMAMQMAQAGNNPMEMLNRVSGSNPQLAQAMKMINGKNPLQLKEMATNMAKERGIDIEKFAQSMGYDEPYNRRGGDRPMNRIMGFAGADEDMTRYGSKVHNDYDGRGNSHMKNGYAMSEEVMPLTQTLAVAWVNEMENADGSRGPHWTMEQTKQVAQQQGITCDPLEFFVAMNMMYSDYCKVAKKNNCSTTEFYADMAKAFLDDKDAKEDKLARYYEFIVE